VEHVKKETVTVSAIATAKNSNNMKHEKIRGVKKMSTRTTFEYWVSPYCVLVTSIVILCFFFSDLVISWSRRKCLKILYPNFSCWSKKLTCPIFFWGGGEWGAPAPPPYLPPAGTPMLYMTCTVTHTVTKLFVNPKKINIFHFNWRISIFSSPFFTCPVNPQYDFQDQLVYK